MEKYFSLKSNSEPLDFKIFWAGMPRDPPGVRNLPCLVLKSGYGPEVQIYGTMHFTCRTLQDVSENLSRQFFSYKMSGYPKLVR